MEAECELVMPGEDGARLMAAAVGEDGGEGDDEDSGGSSGAEATAGGDDEQMYVATKSGARECADGRRRRADGFWRRTMADLWQRMQVVAVDAEGTVMAAAAEVKARVAQAAGSSDQPNRG